MSLTRIGANRVGTDGILITAAGAAVGLDGAVPGRRRVEASTRRRHPHDDPRESDAEDTVTLHQPAADGQAEAPDPVEALRRGGFRRHA